MISSVLQASRTIDKSILALVFQHKEILILMSHKYASLLYHSFRNFDIHVQNMATMLFNAYITRL